MVAVQVTLTLTALMGLLALLVDGGLLYSERRHAQATADAAALAAASDLYANWYTNGGTDPKGSAAASALSVASANGYTNDGTNSTVTVNIPPSSAADAAHQNPGYAEVIVTWNQKRGFSAIFGSGTIPVSARAVAQGRVAAPAILMLGSGPNITDNGSPSSLTVTVPSGTVGTGGSIYVNSTTNAASLQGNGSSVTAPYIYLAQSGSAASGLAASTSMITGAPQWPDPLISLPAPNVGNVGAGVTVDNTYATSGIRGPVPLNPNTIYVVGGNGISLIGQSINANGVMIYLTGANAGISLLGSSSLTLSPLSTGPYIGISIFQDRSDSTGWNVSPNATLSTTGTIYAPAANVAASNGATVASQIIASSLTINGSGNTVAYGTSIAATRSLGLVE
jgi:hypothetical protein